MMEPLSTRTTNLRQGIVLLAYALVIAVTCAAWAVTAHSQSVPRQQDEIVFESGALWLNTAQGRFQFTIEMADTPQKRARGLMFRETMPKNHGMLFDFESERRITMWMRNTPLPLDMIFIRADGTVARIEERTTPFSDDEISSGEPVTHVLEVNAGISRLIGLKPGDRIELP